MSDHQMPATLYYHAIVGGFPRLEGKTIAITGCSSGMGLILARTCGTLGARVIMLNRASERSKSALADVQKTGAEVIGVECDLTRFPGVRRAGAELRALLADTGCDVLCNNAGVMGLKDYATDDGFDIQMQTNHLSHFLLTHELWPVLEKAADLRGEARVVNHSSGARNAPKRDLQAKFMEPRGGKLGGDGLFGFNKWVRYQQSKLANLVFTYALAERAEARPGNKVKSLCAHPGPTDSGLQGKTASEGGTKLMDRIILSAAVKHAHSVEDGTCGLARCCIEPGLDNGAFLGPEGQAKAGTAVVLPAERNPEAEAMLWATSLKATGIRDFFSS